MYDCKLKARLDKLGRAMAMVAGVGLTLMMFVVVINIISRKFFNYPIFGVQEIVRYLSLCIGAIGLLRLEWTDNSIRMTLLVDSVPKKARLVLELITNLIATAGFSAVSYYFVLQIFNSMRSGTLTEDLKLPMTIPTAVLTLGFIALTVCVLVKVILFAAALVKGGGAAPGPDETDSARA